MSRQTIERLQLERKHLKPCLRGGQINRFFTPTRSDDFILYVTEDFVARENPKAFQYLSKNKELLIRKSVEKKSGLRDWHVLFRARSPELFKSPKIMIRQTGDRIIATPDMECGYYCIDSINVALLSSVALPDIKFFVAGLRAYPNNNPIDF